MKLFDAAVTLSADRGEVQLDHLATKMGADPLLVSKCRSL